ncbi:MAG TPA: GNAT family N-acetyltransferase [Oscillatoriaceae cyanobacterium]
MENKAAVGEIVRLTSADQASVYAFLAASPIENVMLMGLILEEGLQNHIYREWIGYREGKRLLAVACISGDISIYAPEERAIAPIAEYALRRVPLVPRIISRKETVDRFFEVFKRVDLPVLFDRHQLVYTLDPGQLIQRASAPVRPARVDEALQVARLASAMSYEEIQMDPLADHGQGYVQLIEDRIRRQRYFVLEEQGVLKFQVQLNSITPYAGQITGVYTPPEFRGQGYGTRGMAEFCRLAFTIVPRLCLFVNDFNLPARKVYEHLGFRQCMEYRAIFMQEPIQA